MSFEPLSRRNKMKKKLLFTQHSFAFIITLLFTVVSVNLPSIAQISDEKNSEPKKADVNVQTVAENSVLNLIPDSSLGVIYCPSLKDLDKKINDAALMLVPQIGVPPELLAQLLAEIFQAGFTSLSELEEIGLDIQQDFAVFFNSLDPFYISAAVHLTDPDAMIEVITAETDGGEPKEYNGASYWTTADESGSFLIIDNILIFSQLPEVCENVIDISNDTVTAIVNHPDYESFIGNIIDGLDQLSVYFNLETIIEPFMEVFNMEIESILDTLESDPTSANSSLPLKLSIDQFMEIVQSSKSFMASLQIDGTDVQLSPFLKFKPDSKVQTTLNQFIPNELTLLNDLPNNTLINGSFQGDAKFLTKLSLSWMNMITMELSENDELSVHLDTMTKQMESVNEALKDEWSFSMNINESIIPDYISIVGLKDEGPVKTYFKEHFITNLEKNMEIMKDALGDSAQIAIYDGVYEGTPLVHNGVEINSIIFPNFGSAFVDVSPEMQPLLPQEWQMAYAISDGFLYFAGGSPEQIKNALDIKTQLVENVGENQSYQNLIDKLGTENNLFIGLSPLNIIKSVMNLVAKAMPQGAAEMEMISGMLMGIPETYSIGISGKVEKGGIGGNLLITLGDFQQLIQTFIMIDQMGM